MHIQKSGLTIVFMVMSMAGLHSCGEQPEATAQQGDSASASQNTSSPDAAVVKERPGAYSQYVDEDGVIALPDNFLTDWAHLGAWAVAADGGVEGIHNVYAPKEDVLYFRKNQEFRDGAMLVKEVRDARGAPHTTGDAHWAEDIQVWFVMVKDREGRFESNPLWGDGWGWALYNGDDRTKQVATDYKQDCLACHYPAEKTDWSYLYAYPTLGPDVAQYAPEEEEEASE